MRPLECFPDLQFRLWSKGAELVPKRSRAEAIRVRRAICSALARSSGIEKFEAPRTLDQADAAVLALSAAAASHGGSMFELSCMPEGRFAVAMPAVRNPRA